MDGNVVDVDQSSFQREVIQRSHDIPVVVDFWAPWCGPCRMLGPILERLAGAPDSKFILAKLNTDENPAVAMQYQIRGIPAVKAFRGGKVVDEFVGAQPEPMVRQFLNRLTAGVSPRPQRRPQPEVRPSDDPGERLEQARNLLREGRGCDADRLLQSFPTGPSASIATQLRPLASFLCDRPRFEDADVDNLLSEAAGALRRRDYSAALYQLLAARNRAAAGDKTRVQSIMQGVFALLGDEDPIVAQYRTYIA